jgi:hypothetical protein
VAGVVYSGMLAVSDQLGRVGNPLNTGANLVMAERLVVTRNEGPADSF